MKTLILLLVNLIFVLFKMFFVLSTYVTVAFIGLVIYHRIMIEVPKMYPNINPTWTSIILMVGIFGLIITVNDKVWKCFKGENYANVNVKISKKIIEKLESES